MWILLPPPSTFARAVPLLMSRTPLTKAHSEPAEQVPAWTPVLSVLPEGRLWFFFPASLARDPPFVRLVSPPEANRPEARVHTEGTTREMETNMKVREAQLSKDTPSRDAISGGGVAPTSPPPRRCDTFDMTCRLAVMAAGGGFAVNVKGMGPYLLPWRCSSGRRGSGVERNPQQPNRISGAAAATGKLPADCRRSAPPPRGFGTDSAGPNVGPRAGRPCLVIWMWRKEIEK